MEIHFFIIHQMYVTTANKVTTPSSVYGLALHILVLSLFPVLFLTTVFVHSSHSLLSHNQ